MRNKGFQAEFLITWTRLCEQGLCDHGVRVNPPKNLNGIVVVDSPF